MPLHVARTPSSLATYAFLVGLLASTAVGAAPAKPTAKGRDALASVRQDWKKDAQLTINSLERSRLPVPANYARLSPEARLAFLHARRALNPVRFDRNHQSLGAILANDDRMKAAQSQNCVPMNGLLPDNALTRYLQFRRSLNPTRFDRFHPTLGAILVEDQKIKAGVNCVAGELIPPPVQPPRPGTPLPNPPIGGGGEIPIRAVPEPGSLALILIGSAGACIPIMARRWRARNTAKP